MAHSKSMQKKPFSYLEVVMAVFLIGILFTPLMTVFGMAMDFSNTSIERSHALDIARAEMERVANLGYDEKRLRQLPPVKDEVFERGGRAYTMRRTIDGNQDPLYVEVIVSTPDTPKLIELVTLIEDNK